MKLINIMKRKIVNEFNNLPVDKNSPFYSNRFYNIELQMKIDELNKILNSMERVSKKNLPFSIVDMHSLREIGGDIVNLTRTYIK